MRARLAVAVLVLAAACTSQPRVDDLLTGEATTRDMAATPDGSRTAIVTDAGTVSFFDTSRLGEAKRLWRESAGHGGLSGVAISPDGRSVLSAGSDRAVDRWDAASGEIAQRFPAAEGGSSVAFSPDGARAFAVGGDALRLLPLAPSDRGFEPVPRVNACGFAFGPDANHVLAQSGEGFVVWDLSAPNGAVKVLPWPADEGGTHRNRIDRQVVFSKNGAWVGCVGFSDCCVWDLQKNVPLWKHALGGSLHGEAVAFAENGGARLLVDDGDIYDRKVFVLDAATGEERSQIRLMPRLPAGPQAWIERVVFVDGGRSAVLLVSRNDGTRSVVRVSL